MATPDHTADAARNSTTNSDANGGAIATPMTACVYDWRILPLGRQLWLRELESYRGFPPMQDPSSYNLEDVIKQVKNMRSSSRGE